MNLHILLSLVFLTNLGISGCLHRAPSLKMLEKRSDYKSELESQGQLKLGGDGVITELDEEMPVRSKPKIAHIWIYPHETKGREYFWGGWISVVVEGDKWEFEKMTRPLGNDRTE